MLFLIIYIPLLLPEESHYCCSWVVALSACVTTYTEATHPATPCLTAFTTPSGPRPPLQLLPWGHQTPPEGHSLLPSSLRIPAPARHWAAKISGRRPTMFSIQTRQRQKKTLRILTDQTVTWATIPPLQLQSSTQPKQIRKRLTPQLPFAGEAETECRSWSPRTFGRPCWPQLSLPKEPSEAEASLSELCNGHKALNMSNESTRQCPNAYNQTYCSTLCSWVRLMQSY